MLDITTYVIAIISLLKFHVVYTVTVEPLLKDTPNKGHNRFNLSIKNKIALKLINWSQSVCYLEVPL